MKTETPASALLGRLNAYEANVPLARTAYERIAREIPGWSSLQHYAFFDCLLAGEPKSILIVGVCHGRDIAFMASTVRQPVTIIGVDKFSDTPCEDWPKEKREQSWKDAGFGDAPAIEYTENNLKIYRSNQANIQLFKSDDSEFLSRCQTKFDAIYLDTSHDEVTVTRQLAQVRPLLNERAIICGDDYENIQPTWGVKNAVKKAMKKHHVIAGCIWFGDAEDLK